MWQQILSKRLDLDGDDTMISVLLNMLLQTTLAGNLNAKITKLLML